MTRSFRGRSDDRWDELEHDADLARLIADARDPSAGVDPAALQTALAVYRVGGAHAAAEPVETEVAEVPARRHRALRALAATTLATKVVLGVATAAAVGGIGVAVTETVRHVSPQPSPTSVTSPVTPPPTSDGSSGGGSSPSPSPTTSPTTSPTSTVTDTASVGASGSPSPSGSPSRSGTKSGSPTSTGSPTRTSSSPRSTSSSPTGGAPSPSGSTR